MTSSIRFLVTAAIVAGAGLLASASTSPASAGQYDWLGNKDYISCLQLFYTGDFLMPANASPAERAAKHEAGRRYCNRQFYGHD